MPITDQLEIIRPDGVVEFYDLTPDKGITNIGSHPDNDIFLPGERVAAFHCVLDHRRQPFQLVVVDDQNETRLDGQSIGADRPTALNNWDTVEFGPYTVILLLGTQGVTAARAPSAAPGPGRFGVAGPGSVPPPVVSSAAPPSPTPAPPIASVSPAPVGNGGGASAFPLAVVSAGPGGSAGSGFGSASRAAAGNGFGNGHRGGNGSGALYAEPLPYTPIVTPVLDHVDEMILATLVDRELVADVDSTVALHLNITNGGDLVASFNVQVEGCDPSWVVILPAQINLNEEESGIVTVTITPPRMPFSTAGSHYLAISITSPEYTDRYSQLGATLHINPYYEVLIGDLSRKKQESTYNNPVTESEFAIGNNGNNVVQVQVEGRDDDRGLEFEFFLPNVNQTFSRQAELRLNPSESQEVTMFIEPHQRRMIGLRNKTYQFTITATPLGGQQFPRTIAGQVVTKPLIGKWAIFSTFLLLLITALIAFSPGVYVLDAEPNVVSAGTPVVLAWEASRFAGLELAPPDAVSFETQPQGTAVVMPVRSTTYQVTSRNLLSRLGIPPLLFDESKEVKVFVTPVNPEVKLSVDRDTIVLGENVVVAWQISRADSATLYTNGNPQALPTDQFVGSIALEPKTDTTFRIEASNPSVENPIAAQSSSSVIVWTPTPTPLPNPRVLVFDVQPTTVLAGEPVNVTWRVQSAPSVSIEGIGAELPPEGSRQVFPGQSTTYLLRATTLGGDAFSQEVSVTVLPQPTATPLPGAPVIEFFQSSPKEVVQGASQRITLTWSIKGDLTGVTVFSPDISLNTSFSRTGKLPVTVNKTTFFILTAVNVDKSVTSQVDITALEPTPTPTATFTPVPPTPAPTAVPPPNIVYFGVTSGATPTNLDEVRQIGTNEYEVVVGALLKISWSANSATSLMLDGKGTQALNFGTRPFDGEMVLQYDGTITEFVLTATNDPAGNPATSKTASASVRITAREVIPSDPFNLSGSVDGSGQNQLTWSYAAQDQQRISGFRLYRANVSDMNFAAVAETGPLVTNFTDTTLPACGRAYFVVATYRDFRGNVLETGPSATSWFSPNC
ncbi:MAG: FHA domain-containing protein [Caldilineaceae bacterium]